MKSVGVWLNIKPIPLSACFRNANGPGRADTKRYTKWKREVDQQIMVQRPAWNCADRPLIDGKVEVTICFPRGGKRAWDLDNALKAPLDALVRNGIIRNDSLVETLVATKSYRQDIFIGVKGL